MYRRQCRGRYNGGMSLSFKLSKPLDPPTTDGTLKVLVTGAGGSIGSYFASHNEDRFDLRLGCHGEEEAQTVGEYGETVQLDVTDLDSCKAACEGVDVVLHLAADPSPYAAWDTLLPINIVGTYNIFAAAKAAGVKRVVYASSIHAISGHARDRQVNTAEPVNPGDLYGVTKCFGEAMGRYMAEQEGVACIVIRIGAFQPRKKVKEEGMLNLLDAFVSRRDLNQLLQKAVRAEHLQFAIVQGLSDNQFKRMDIQTARDLLGYEPVDDLTEMNPDLEKLHLHDAVMSHALPSEDKSGLRNDV